MNGKNDLTVDILENLYINKNKTAKEIANMYDYKSVQSILNKLHKNNIPVRDYKEAQINNTTYIDDEWLINQYEIYNKTITAIAMMLDCSINTVRRRLINLDVEIKKRYDLSKDNFKRFYGEDNPSWKGGRFKRKDGYVLKYMGDKKYMLEHRYIMEQYLGRELLEEEQIHHINGIKDDNRIENLMVTDIHEHIKIHKMRGDL